MTETIDSPPAKRAGGLSTMLLADLRAMAAGLGVAGAESMKKAQLVEAIKAGQGAASSAAAPAKKAAAKKTAAKRTAAPPASEPAPEATPEPAPAPVVESTPPKKRSRGARKTAEADTDPAPELPIDLPTEQPAEQPVEQPAEQPAEQPVERAAEQPVERAEAPVRDRRQEPRESDQQPDQQPDQDSDQQSDDGEGRTGRNRRRRGRDRNRATSPANPSGPAGNQGPANNNQGNQGNQGPVNNQGNQANQSGQGNQSGQNPGAHANRHEPDTSILDDDVLVPAAGILDVLENYAFVRTSGYLPGPDDVYVSLSMVRKFGLRRGDAIVGQVRQPREGERKEKFNPMVRIENVNGGEPEAARTRPEFAKLTALYPSERLRLETGPDNLIGRLVDLAAPIGKGQRGLIVSPANAGKTMIMQAIASSISVNNPECHLMVVLVDERPEEVTDFQRSVKGEVISSTFDRPAADHTIVAELAIERAKRLVELGHDVVVLLDGITRLGRAYHHSTPASGRILAGGVDSAALHPAKRFFGAARNIEHGGSLTIIATATVESGSATDEAIFEEFTGTGNMELRLRRDLAERRLFPAVDAVLSGTRREELLMGDEEVAIVWKLRRVLSELEAPQALELLLGRLSASQTNIEFLMQVQKSTPANPLTAGQDH